MSRPAAAADVTVCFTAKGTALTSGATSIASSAFQKAGVAVDWQCPGPRASGVPRTWLRIELVEGTPDERLPGVLAVVLSVCPLFEGHHGVLRSHPIIGPRGQPRIGAAGLCAGARNHACHPGGGPSLADGRDEGPRSPGSWRAGRAGCVQFAPRRTKAERNLAGDEHPPQHELSPRWSDGPSQRGERLSPRGHESGRQRCDQGAEQPRPRRRWRSTCQPTATGRCATPPNCPSARRATAGVIHAARSVPPTVPTATRASDSNSSCFTISKRRAPRALLTASSRRRSINRTSNRPEKLANAINAATATAPARRARVPVASPEMAVAMGVALVRAGGDQVRLTSSSAPSSDAAEAPAARRATTLTRRPSRAARSARTGSGPPQIGPAQLEEEPLRQNADDRVEAPAENERASDDGRVGGQLPAPEGVAEDDHGSPGILRLERAAQCRARAEERQQSGCHVVGAQPLGRPEPRSSSGSSRQSPREPPAARSARARLRRWHRTPLAAHPRAHQRGSPRPSRARRNPRRAGA